MLRCLTDAPQNPGRHGRSELKGTGPSRAQLCASHTHRVSPLPPRLPLAPGQERKEEKADSRNPASADVPKATTELKKADI